MEKVIRVLSLGAGVQSTTMLQMIVAGEIEPVDHVIFADTGWEPKAVYEHLETLKVLCKQHQIPFHQVTEGNIREDALDPNKRFASMPLYALSLEGKKGMARRQCTSEYKLKPLLRKQRELAGLAKGQRSKKHLMTTLIGISYDETQRMRDAAFPWMKNEYSLVDRKMTREDCLIWMADHSLPKPPRSACIGCPFKSNDEWLALRQDPESWADAVDFDERIRHARPRFTSGMYLHRSMKPLSQTILQPEDAGQGALFENECLGMCGN